MNTRCQYVSASYRTLPQPLVFQNHIEANLLGVRVRSRDRFRGRVRVGGRVRVRVRIARNHIAANLFWWSCLSNNSSRLYPLVR